MAEKIYDFGLLLKECRNKKKLTQAQVAERLNISRASINGYEHNTITPSLEMLCSLALLYNVSTDMLLNLNKRQYIAIDGLTKNQTNLVEGLILEFKTKKKR